ncbi:MAG: LysR substrate-binding domain-containing protein, partial [Pseudomonadota bacterium]
GVDGSRGPVFNQSSLVVEAAVAGRGVALAKSALAESDLAAGRLVVAFDVATPIAFAYHLVRPPAHDSNPAVRAFMNWVRAE